MRSLLFLFILAFTFTQGLQAQNLGHEYPILTQWETYIQDHQNESIPNEKTILKESKQDLAAEKTALNKNAYADEDLLQSIRTNYWRTLFLQQNSVEINKAKLALKTTTTNNHASKNGAQTGENPSFYPENCGVNIVVVVDRSGSIQNGEDVNIRNGLLAFINNQNAQNTNNTVTFVGMGQNGNNGIVIPAIISETVTYGPGSTTSHTNWINNVLDFNNQEDSWFTGFQAAASLSPDLVILVADGDQDNGVTNELAQTCAAANVLKDAGTHLFVIGKDGNTYELGSLAATVENAIDPAPEVASLPLTMDDISTLDYFSVGDDFADLDVWLSAIEGVIGGAEVTSITGIKGYCLEGSICFSGTYFLCKGVFQNQSAQLVFHQNGVEIQSLTIPLSNGTFFRCYTKQELVDFGLNTNTEYDVFLSLGTTQGPIMSAPYVEGDNNDFQIIPGPGYATITDIDGPDGACNNSNVCFYGEYDLCKGNFLNSPPVLLFRENGLVIASVNIGLFPDGTFEACFTQQDLINAGLSNGGSYDAYVYLNSSAGYSITSQAYIPGNNNDFTLNTVGAGEVAITDIDIEKDPCLESPVCIAGTYFLCPGNNAIPPTQLVFFQNGSSVASAPITLLANGTFEECFTKLQLLNLGLNSSESYDVFAQVNTDGGTTLVSPAYTAGFNNDFLLVTYQAEIVEVPECVEEGVPFQIEVIVDGWLNASDFENVYSSDNNYTYVSHAVQWLQGMRTRVVITFISKTCSCAGEVLVFDMVVKGCSTPIWLMTHDPIPCCADECAYIKIKDWEAGDCFYYNGNLARPFTIVVASGSPIYDAISVGNTATCQTTIADINVSPGLPGTYVITGNMIFDDPNCDGHAWLSFNLDTKEGCCSIDQQFSFPKGCTINKDCDIGPVVPQIIADGNPPVMSVSLNLPSGTTVQVLNNLTGTTSTATVQTISCAPFFINQNGGVGGGTPCNGIKITAAFDFDCRKDIEQNTEYSYTISFKKCDWIIAGDYCDILTVYKSSSFTNPETETEISSQERSAPLTEASQSGFAEAIKVYPNPIQTSEVLNFDFSQSEVVVQHIRITDLSGKLIEIINPPNDRSSFSHYLSTDLSQGVYFVFFALEDGRVESKKLIAIQ